jgi:Tol biopolymer transport system component
MMPDGSLLFTILRGGFLSRQSSIAAWPADAGSETTDAATKPQAREVMSNATSPQLVGSDAIVFAQGRTLFAAGFDSRALRVIGEARALGRQVQTAALSMAPMYAVARNGTLVYAKQAPGRRLVWIDRRGREELVKADEKMYLQLRLSPDGRRVAIHVADADGDLWVLALDGSSMQRLTSGPGGGGMPTWTADGSEIFFTSGGRTINRVRADRSTGPVPVFTVPKPERIFPMAITSDGKRLLTQWDESGRSPRFELRVLELGPPPALAPLVGESGTEHNGRLSPNGRWLLYQSAESLGGRDGQIKVRPFPDVQAGHWTISPGAGRTPIWSHDGTEIFYRTEDGTVMSVPVSVGPTGKFTPGIPVRVMTPAGVLRDWGSGPTFDVSPDGQSFLFIKAPELDIRSLEVVLNWDVEVKAAIGRKEQ